MEGYQSSLDGNDDNFDFNNMLVMMPKASLECSISYFVFYFALQMFEKLEYAFR